MRALLLALFLAGPILAQPSAAFNVTISQQPTTVFVASFGASVYKISVYSGEVCSSPGFTVSGSWGQIRQIAEGAGLNIVDNALVGALAQSAASKTKLHKAVVYIGWAALTGTFVALLHSPPPWAIQTGLIASGSAQIIDSQLAGSLTQAAANTAAALGVLADLSAQFSVSNGACVVSRILFGQTRPNFVPIKASLPAMPNAPALRGIEAPTQQIPTSTHPVTANIDLITVWYQTSWIAPEDLLALNAVR